ncbi:hypothetical protein EVAR_62880_1 [Eumeta japonica]|uniref:Mariner Mos1 transposase n=1 Tax=Eumeta variegata TaxID=151549 RepID=A0A4C1Z495_EUMVA|nr:hypothetical protein EVAR_62880_1 [Eumeta japonica]
MLKDEFKEGRLKSIGVPLNIDAVWELIKQDRHVTYREIKSSLGISKKIKLTGHAPCSSDLAPNNFYLFPSVKNKLSGQRFSSLEEVKLTKKSLHRAIGVLTI